MSIVSNGHELSTIDLHQPIPSNSLAIPGCQTSHNLTKGSVIFLVGSEKIRTYNLMLKHLSTIYPYFKEALRGKSSEVKISNITPAAFIAFLRFVDDGKVHLERNDWININSLIKFGEVKGIEDQQLKGKCLFLLDLNVLNAQDVYLSCIKNNLEEGKNLAFDFILKNWKPIEERGLLKLSRFRSIREDFAKLTQAILQG